MDSFTRLVAGKILDYLAQNPQAEDTIEGIVEWWLLERRIRYSSEDVEAALRVLVRNEFLVTRESSEGRTYYRLNRAKEREISSHGTGRDLVD